MTGVLFVKTKGSNADDVYAYYHHDQRGAPLEATNRQGDVVWAAAYEPFGRAQVITPASTTGYSTIESKLRLPGQIADSETGLHYNFYRDYDPETGRYIQSDPIGLVGGQNTYAYLGGNPLAGADPYGLMCISKNGFTTCFTKNGPTFRVPSPPNFPESLGPGDPHYHEYDEMRPLDGADAKCVMEGMMNKPTPGDTFPALPQGTRNNATVGIGKWPRADNWVTSYKTKDLVTGEFIAVNIAGRNDGSLFGPGYVVRYVRNGIAHTAGEGTAIKQSPKVTGTLIQDIGNYAIWGRQMSEIIDEAKKCGCK